MNDENIIADEIRIEFADGTSTLEWVLSDDDAGDVVADMREQEGVEIESWEFTGNVAAEGQY